MAFIWHSLTVILALWLMTCHGDDWRLWQKGTLGVNGLIKPDLKYAFILIRTGMRTLDYRLLLNSKTFPNDNNYRESWKSKDRGELLEPGETLMGLVGRSLRGRYGPQMFRWVKRAISMSRIEKKTYTNTSGHAVSSGLVAVDSEEYKTFGHPTPAEVAFDKTLLFDEPNVCPAYGNLIQESNEAEKPILRDNEQFLDTLNSNIEWFKEPEWDMKRSLERVYWLWDILQTEKYGRVQKKDQKPKWLDENTENTMRELVKQYLNLSIKGPTSTSRLNMAKYLVGTLFSQIDQKLQTSSRLHIHITDERMFSAFKSVLTQTDPSPVQFGETLMIEVYDDDKVKAFTFRPLEYSGLRELKISDLGENVDYGTFKAHFESILDLPMTEDKWKMICESGESSSINGNTYNVLAYLLRLSEECLEEIYTHIWNKGRDTHDGHYFRSYNSANLQIEEDSSD